MKNIELFDSTFTLSKITAYSLSLEIDYNHIAYTIVDHIRKRFVALVSKYFDRPLNEANFLDVIDNHIKADPYLQKHYKEVNFIYPSDKFILVPEQYFDKKNLKLYFEYSNSLDEGQEVQFNYLPDIKTYLLFAISSNITNFFVFRFPEINFYHQGIPLIKNYVKKSAKNKGVIAVLSIRKNFLFDILIVNEGKLLFYNIYKFTDTTTVLYTILRVIKDFGYDIYLELLGEISEQDELYQQLIKYFPKASFAKLQDEYELEFSKETDIHKFANLFYISE